LVALGVAALSRWTVGPQPHLGSHDGFFNVGIRVARAQAGEVFVPCVFRGRAVMPLNTIITDAVGRPIARFSGSETTLVVAGLSTATPARARIETGTGQGGFRVRGFVEAQKLPMATTENVPVVAGRVWIGARRGVSVVGAAPDKLKIEKRLATPLMQSFSAWTSCSRLGFGTPVPPGWSPAGDARGYVLRKSSLDLYDRPEGSVVSVLNKAADAAGVLFFSTEQTSAWVHVEYHGEVVVDGWARASELQPLARGETMDQLASQPAVRNPARLALPGTPRVVRTTREVPLRTAAKEGEPVGIIESGAETYVLDVVAGWASVLPKSLDVMPIENGQFWVKKAELGI
jgi:hypothetical protein